MKIIAILRELPTSLRTEVDRVVGELRQREGFEVAIASSLVDAGPADAFLLCGDDHAALAAELSAAASVTPTRLARTLLVGPAPGFRSGRLDADPGTAVELMEKYRLGGCIGPKALTDWQDAPSWFAGPQHLMAQLRSNALKAFQSENYAIWFAARGATLVEFLASYLPALADSVANGG